MPSPDQEQLADMSSHAACIRSEAYGALSMAIECVDLLLAEVGIPRDDQAEFLADTRRALSRLTGLVNELDLLSPPAAVYCEAIDIAEVIGRLDPPVSVEVEPGLRVVGPRALRREIGRLVADLATETTGPLRLERHGENGIALSVGPWTGTASDPKWGPIEAPRSIRLVARQSGGDASVVHGATTRILIDLGSGKASR